MTQSRMLNNNSINGYYNNKNNNNNNNDNDNNDNNKNNDNNDNRNHQILVLHLCKIIVKIATKKK